LFMAHYLYVIFSESGDTYYKGETSNPEHRLEDHNNNKSTYTSGKGPWKLVYLEELPDRRAALAKEKIIKRLNRRSIEKLLKSTTNILNRPVTSRQLS